MIGHSFAQKGILVALLLTIGAAPAFAEVIAIKRGTLVFENGQGGRLNISGTRGFRLQASTLSGRFNLQNQCAAPECQPGTVVEIGAFWSGNDLPGTAELRGTTYPDVGGLNSPNSAEIELSGEVTMPPMSDGPITFKAPFEFAGRFTYAPDLQTPSQTVSLTGGGRVILELIPNGDSWLIGDITFEFRPAKRD